MSAVSESVVLLDPKDIVVNQDLRGRHFTPSAKDVDALLVQIKAHEQLEPVGIWYNEKEEAELIYGYTRWAAAMKGKLKLECKVLDDDRLKDPAYRFLLNMDENRSRKQTSPVDDAFNVKRLQEEFKMSNTDIAKKLNVSKVWVGQLLKLTKLGDKILRDIHEGKIGMRAAVALSDLPEEKQEQALAKAQASETGKGKQKGKKVKDSTVKRAVKKAKGEKEDKGPKPLKSKDVYDFFLSLTGKIEKDTLREFGMKSKAFVAGKLSETAYEKYLREVFKAPAKATATAE